LSCCACVDGSPIKTSDTHSKPKVRTAMLLQGVLAIPRPFRALGRANPRFSSGDDAVRCRATHTPTLPTSSPQGVCQKEQVPVTSSFGFKEPHNGSKSDIARGANVRQSTHGDPAEQSIQPSFAKRYFLAARRFVSRIFLFSRISIAESLRSTCGSERGEPECSRQRSPAAAPQVEQSTENSCLGVRSCILILTLCGRMRI